MSAVLARSLDPVARRMLPPHCYLWAAIWWWADSNRGYPSSAQSRVYSRNQRRLYRDMIRNPEYYQRRPREKTDWEWSGLKSSDSSPVTQESHS